MSASAEDLADLRTIQARQLRTIRQAAPWDMRPAPEAPATSVWTRITELELRLVAADLLADHATLLDQLELYQAKGNVGALAIRMPGGSRDWVQAAAESLGKRYYTDDPPPTDLTNHEARPTAMALRDAAALLVLADVARARDEAASTSNTHPSPPTTPQAII